MSSFLDKLLGGKPTPAYPSGSPGAVRVKTAAARTRSADAVAKVAPPAVALPTAQQEPPVSPLSVRGAGEIQVSVEPTEPTRNLPAHPAPPRTGGVREARLIDSPEQLQAALGKPWEGLIDGVVGVALRASALPLYMGCGKVVLLCTPEFYEQQHTHLETVKKRITGTGTEEWGFDIVQSIKASPALCTQVLAEFDLGKLKNEALSLSFDARFLRVYDDIVAAGIHARASDIHFQTVENIGSVSLRVYGQYREWLTLQPKLILDVLSAAFGKRVKANTNTKEQFKAEVPSAFMTTQFVAGSTWDGRFNGRPHVVGYKGVMRLLETSMRLESIPTLAQLGYLPSQIEMMNSALARQSGLMVIFGSTGSGKSTTLRTFLCESQLRGLVRYAVESPAEYRIPGVFQISIPVDVNAERDKHANALLAALRDAMRMDPDVLMVGEVREKESGSLVIEFTTSGHRCMTTCHAEGCVDGFLRFSGGEIAIPKDTLGGPKVINSSIYQKLLPVLCPHCRVSATHPELGLPESKRKLLREKYRLEASLMFVANPQGCAYCKPALPELAANGTNGVTVAAEILIPDAAMRRAIVDGDWPLLERLWRGQRTSSFGDGDMRGKTAYEAALYKAIQGHVSILDIEANFEPLESYEVFPISTEGVGV